MGQKAYDYYNQKMHNVIDRMLATRPKKDVVYRPFTDHVYHTKNWSYDRCANLTTVFGKSVRPRAEYGQFWLSPKGWWVTFAGS